MGTSRINQDDSHTRRWLSTCALGVEWTLILVCAAGMAALFYFLSQLPEILAPDESPVLARARAIRGVIFVAMPLVFALGLTYVRSRLSHLFLTHTSGGMLVWLVMVGALAILVFVAGNQTWQGIAELRLNS